MPTTSSATISTNSSITLARGARLSRHLAPYLVAPVLALMVIPACDMTDDTADDGPHSVQCGQATIDMGVSRVAYELFDLTTGSVWATPDFTPEEFAALEISADWAKNQPREASISGSRFARSPDCGNDGEFTEAEISGKPMQHIANLLGPGQVFDESGLLFGNQVGKYHEIDYRTGDTLFVLVAPDGARYVRVSRDAQRTGDNPTVPAGWTLTSYTLTEDMTVDLSGSIDVLRTDNQDSFQGPLADDIELAAYGVRDSIRGVRTCELMELAIVGDSITFVAWNEGGMHDCPDEWLAQVDRTLYGVGGPRWRSIDALAEIDSDGHTVPDVEPDIEPDVAEVPAGLGYDMVRVAEVPFLPVADLEQQLGITIETVADIPVPVRQGLLAESIASDGYQVYEVSRALRTRMSHHAGAQIFAIDDGQCRYAMKFYTSVVDPELTDETAIATLGQRFAQLPVGFSFEVVTLEEDLIVTDTDGTAYVMADEFGNSYDRFECQ